MGLRVLITNINLWPPSGTALYTRDLALELQRQGHTPAVFSSTSGAIAEELRSAGIEVTDDLGRLREAPDIIHGHQYAPTLVALRHWPTVPAVHICHDHMSANDRTPIHRNIRRHLGVSRICVQRLIGDGVPVSRVELALNFVDLARFSPRPPLPERPRRALVISNYARKGSPGHLQVVIEACRRAGIDVDVVGAGVGRIVARPELLLPGYEIVFAKAKAAMEAMAVGTAVVLCDFSGVGPMVTSQRFDELRPLNFGFEALDGPMRPEVLLREMDRYDPEDAERVCHLIRSRAGLVAAVESLVAIYGEAIADHRRDVSRTYPEPSKRWAVREALFLRIYRRWNSVPPQLRARIKNLRGAKAAERGLRRFLGQTASSA